jgi:hypothetical protein
MPDVQDKSALAAALEGSPAPAKAESQPARGGLLRWRHAGE